MIRLAFLTLLSACLAIAQTQVDYNSQLRNKPIINVTQYGAKCDGVTDDTAAIQAAINATASAASGVVVFPNSTSGCLITAGLQIANRSGLTLTSSGNATIRVKAGVTDTLYNSWPNFGKDSIFRVTNSSSIVFSNLTLDGNLPNRTANAGSESQNSDITLAGAAGVLIDNCTLINGMTDSLAMVGYGTPQTAINSNIWIRDSVLTNSRRNNLSIVAGQHVYVLNNVITGAGSVQGTLPKDGIDVEPNINATDVADVTIAGNNVSNNTAEGIRWLGNSGMQVQDLKITGNTVNNNGTHGIAVDQSGSALPNKQVVISNNTTSGNAFNGIFVRGSSLNGAAVDLITGNSSFNNQNGIVEYGSADLVIAGNTVHNNTYTGIGLGSSGFALGFANVTVSGNVIYDNASTAGIAAGAGFAVDAWTNISGATLVLTGNTFYSTATASPLMRGVFLRSGGTGINLANRYSNLASDFAPFAGTWTTNPLNGLTVQDVSVTNATITAGPNQANNAVTTWKANSGNNLFTLVGNAAGFNTFQTYRASDGAIMSQISYNGSGAAGSQWWGINNVAADYLWINSQTGSVKMSTGSSGITYFELNQGHRFLLNGATDDGASLLQVNGTLALPPIKATSGARYVCINTTGQLISQAAACSGT